MGRLAVQILLQQLKQSDAFEPTHVVLEHQLIVRGST
jgi:DNA-binding LacI/PurR family transcriptional regulator